LGRELQGWRKLPRQDSNLDKENQNRIGKVKSAALPPRFPAISAAALAQRLSKWPDLAAIVAAWERLPRAARERIVAVVREHVEGKNSK
jgi:hypothetical protein